MATLYIVSTPIGNLEDITIRAIKTLLSVPIIACEDTRHTGQLLKDLRDQYPHYRTQIETPRLISYYDEIEEKRTPEIISMLQDRHDIALVSDAGTPLIADPGYRLIQACLSRNITVRCIPGPTSFLTVLPISGFSTHEFSFVGYLPPTAKKRIDRLASLRKDQTIICFESSHRVQETLRDIHALYGDIQLCIGKELTKLHEHIYRGTVSDVIQSCTDTRGEFVLIFRIPSV